MSMVARASQVANRRHYVTLFADARLHGQQDTFLPAARIANVPGIHGVRYTAVGQPYRINAGQNRCGCECGCFGHPAPRRRGRRGLAAQGAKCNRARAAFGERPRISARPSFLSSPSCRLSFSPSRLLPSRVPAVRSRMCAVPAWPPQSLSVEIPSPVSRAVMGAGRCSSFEVSWNFWVTRSSNHNGNGTSSASTLLANINTPCSTICGSLSDRLRV